MTKAVLFSSNRGDINASMAFINNLSATTAPGVGNDSASGYEVGSAWVNTATGIVYTCVDATAGAAVWAVTSSDETTPGQITAPHGTASAAGGTAFLKGGAGGTTTGNGGPASLVGGAATAGNSTGGAAATVGGAGQGTGTGGAAKLTGGASGAGATGNGGQAQVTGGAAGSTDGNGGSVVITAGAKAGSGVDGAIIERGVRLVSQGAPAAKTVSATLTAAEVLTGIITVNQGGAGASAQQLPAGADLDTALPDAAAGDAFDFSVINISATAAESASLTTNTGLTLVGDMDVSANSAATTKSAGRFRARKTGTALWTVYRLS